MPKTQSIRVRLTEEEWETANQKSQQLFGINNKSKLIRKLLRDYSDMGIDLTESELQSFREAVRQLTGIARNLNQITARINTDSSNIKWVHEDYVNELKNRVETVNQSLKNYIEHSIKRFQKKVNTGD